MGNFYQNIGELGDAGNLNSNSLPNTCSYHDFYILRKNKRKK